MDFNYLATLEPRLVTMMNEIIKEKPPTRYSECWQRRWYSENGYKSRLLKLVGYYCEHPLGIMHTSKAYEIAYHTLCEALPQCEVCSYRGCGSSPVFDYEYNENDDY